MRTQRQNDIQQDSFVITAVTNPTVYHQGVTTTKIQKILSYQNVSGTCY